MPTLKQRTARYFQSRQAVPDLNSWPYSSSFITTNGKSQGGKNHNCTIQFDLHIALISGFDHQAALQKNINSGYNFYVLNLSIKNNPEVRVAREKLVEKRGGKKPCMDNPSVTVYNMVKNYRNNF